MNFKWNLEKNKRLKIERGVCFEDVVNQIYEGQIIDIISHPNEEKYPEQKIYIIRLQGYIHVVPFITTKTEIFLKTIIPSRKMNRIYKENNNGNG